MHRMRRMGLVDAGREMRVSGEWLGLRPEPAGVVVLGSRQADACRQGSRVVSGSTEFDNLCHEYGLHYPSMASVGSTSGLPPQATRPRMRGRLYRKDGSFEVGRERVGPKHRPKRCSLESP